MHATNDIHSDRNKDMPTLDFKGKQHIYAHHLTVPHCPLVIDAGKSLNMADSDDNLIIHGDNLHALKALLPRYAGKIKCIYIDPPYNRGNEGWVYNDNVNSPVMKKWLEENRQVDDEDLERHDKWLCMIWPRLHLLKQLLAQDGVIFVSIDDHEQHHLQLIMDEIFGEHNFIASFVWEGTAKNDARFVSTGHDYIKAYAADFAQMKLNGKKWRLMKEGLDDIYNRVADLKREHGEDYEAVSDGLQAWYRTLPKNHKSWRHKHYNWVDERGVYFAGDISWPGGGGPTYEVLHPSTHLPVTVPARGWVYAKREDMDKAIEDNRIHFAEDEAGVPNLKRYLHETDQQVLTSVLYQDRRAAHQNLAKILGPYKFQHPKDDRVLARLLEAITSGEDIVLDSFAGSGTTAHAVLALNKTDGGNRKFILVECEDYADSVTAERVRRIISGVPEASEESLREGLGGSFTYCTLGDPIDVEGMLTGKSLPEYAELAAYLLNTASGLSVQKELKPQNEDGLFFSHGDTDYYLLYRPEIKWLRSNEAILNEHQARQIHDTGRSAVVFAVDKFMGQRFLADMGITFCQIPYELHRLE